MIRLVHGDGTVCEQPGQLHFELGKAPEALVCPEVEFAVARHGGGPPYLMWRRRPEPESEIIQPWGPFGGEIFSTPFDAGKWRALLAVQTAEEQLEAASRYIQARFVSTPSSPPWAPLRNWYVDEFRREREGRWTTEEPA